MTLAEDMTGASAHAPLARPVGRGSHAAAAVVRRLGAAVPGAAVETRPGANSPPITHAEFVNPVLNGAEARLHAGEETMTPVTFVDRPYSAVRREHTLSVRFDAFSAALESVLGVMDVSALGALGPESAEAARAKLASFVGPSGFALFQKIDHGALLSALTGRKVRATTYVFGNALIAIEMTKHAPEVGLYVPLRLYLRELEAGKILLVHDLPSHAVRALGSADASRVAEGLDGKIEALVADTVERARVTP